LYLFPNQLFSFPLTSLNKFPALVVSLQTELKNVFNLMNSFLKTIKRDPANQSC
jgi:hypothetical protein